MLSIACPSCKGPYVLSEVSAGGFHLLIAQPPVTMLHSCKPGRYERSNTLGLDVGSVLMSCIVYHRALIVNSFGDC